MDVVAVWRLGVGVGPGTGQDAPGIKWAAVLPEDARFTRMLTSEFFVEGEHVRKLAGRCPVDQLLIVNQADHLKAQGVTPNLFVVGYGVPSLWKKLRFIFAG